MLTSELIKAYELRLDGLEPGIDLALLCLLKINEKQITGLVEDDPDRFHKFFRIIDVCEDSRMDLAIWCLLDQVEIFWEVFEKLNA